MGVSMMAIITLKKTPCINKFENLDHSITLPLHRRKSIKNVSRDCEKIVDKLFRIQRCLPFKIRFQK